MIKPGYKTSEFWFTLVSFVFSGLYLVGLLEDTSQKENLIQETSRGLEAVILIIGQLTVLYKYINSRKVIKETWWNTASPEERQEEVSKIKKPNSRRKKNESSRNTKTGSGKPNSRSKTSSKRS